KAPSTEAKNENMLLGQNPKNPTAIYNGRPAEMTGPPICIYDAVFSRFIENVESGSTQVTSEDLEQAHQFVLAVVPYYKREDERQTAITAPLTHFWGAHSVTKSTYTVSHEKYFTPDGSLAITIGLLTLYIELTEIKNAIGSGGGCDPTDQACKGYLMMCLDPKARFIRNSTHLPAFLASITGEQLTVSGVVYVDRAIVQRLTYTRDLVPPTPTGQDAYSRHLFDIARLMRCVGDAVEELKKYYEELPMATTRPVFHPTPHFKSFNFKGHCIELQYLGLLGVNSEANYHAIFEAMLPPVAFDARVVVKFTSTYCAEAHQFMASIGAAPQLLYCERRPDCGMLYAVVMLYAEGGAPTQATKQKAFDTMRSNLERLHKANFVFGDVRAPNVIDAQAGPLFIDFDWSGPHGTARFPVDLNPKIPWPEGAKAGGAIEPKHDLALLHLMQRALLF
ncbi:hypothetical protein DFH06DRAFT_982837, partial [Mycena polygramma]